MWIKIFDESEKDMRFIDMNSVKEFHAFETVDNTTVTKTLYKIKFYYKNEGHETWTCFIYNSKETRDKVLNFLEKQLDIWDVDKIITI